MADLIKIFIKELFELIPHFLQISAIYLKR